VIGVADEIPTDRERRTEEQRLRDRRLLEQVESRRSVGEELARSGQTPAIDRPPPTIRSSTSDANTASTGDRTPVGEVRPITGPRRAGRRRWWPRVLQVAAALFALVVAYFLFSLWQVWSTGNSDQARQVDAIVVMGAAQYDGRPSPQLEARLDHVIELWPDDVAPLIVVTGGNQPGDRFTESDASASYLIDAGIDSSSILKESEGASTYESLAAAAKLLEARGLDRVLIVTDPYHALRSRLIAEDLGLEAYTSPTSTSVVTGTKAMERQLGEAAGVAIGRIIGFERLDDLTD
jgi:uncharacterized SAM-binding protein YcdF (DUF218 family)